MATAEDIVRFARDFSGENIRCGEDSDLLERKNINGPRAEAVLNAYAKEFAVDAEQLRASFHYDASGAQFWRRERPVGQHGKTFARIPITARLLADAANEGHWPLEYPSHRMQRSRWPLIVMFLLLASLVLAVTILGAQ
jgi:hypothetical protein